MLGFKVIEQFSLNECDDLLKRTDISTDDRLAAERRRNELMNMPQSPQPPQKSILEEFPEYGFIPTSTLTKRRLYIIPAIIVALGILWVVDDQYDVGIPVLCIGFLSLIKCYYYNKNIKTVTDYYPTLEPGFRQGKTGCFNLTIFVKNRKFGLMKAGINKVLIPAKYDKLIWRDRYTLIAHDMGRNFIIDIYGNELS